MFRGYSFGNRGKRFHGDARKSFGRRVHAILRPVGSGDCFRRRLVWVEIHIDDVSERNQGAHAPRSDSKREIMPRKGEAFAGLSVAIVTPFNDGKVDYPALKQAGRISNRAGTDCICPVGTTGESPTLSHEEHERVIAAVVRVRQRADQGHARHRQQQHGGSARLTKFAKRAGADAALVVAPYYNKPTQEGFYQHFKALAEAVDLPICVYNIPGRTGKEHRAGNDRPHGRVAKTSRW